MFNINLRHPAVLAQDLATLDILSGGRLEVGLGAGWNKPEHDAIGIPFESAGTRIAKLEEAIQVMKGCFADGPFSFQGSTTRSPTTTARPSRSSAPPAVLPGRRRQAPPDPGRPRGPDRRPGPRIIDRHRRHPQRRPAQRHRRRHAGEDRLDPRRCRRPLRRPGAQHVPDRGFPTCITDEPLAEARRRAEHLKKRSGHEISAEDILDSPHHYLGTLKGLTEKFLRLREELGISSFLIDDLDALAPLVEELAGR